MSRNTTSTMSSINQKAIPELIAINGDYVSRSRQTGGLALPEELIKVLTIRSKTGLICPEDIRSRIAQIRSRVESFRGSGMVSRKGSSQDISNSPNGGSGGSGGNGWPSRKNYSEQRPYKVNSYNSTNSVASNSGSGKPDNFWGNRTSSESQSFTIRAPSRVSSFESVQSGNATARSSSYQGGFSSPSLGNNNKTTNSPVASRQKYNRPSHNTGKQQLATMPEGNRFAQLSEKDSDEPCFAIGEDVVATPSSTGYMKFKSKFKKDANNEDELDDRILGHIRAKINKFSAQNYKKVLNFLRQNMDSEEKEFLEQFMSLIFSKAAEEDTFVSLYAQLLSDLTPEFPYLLDEMKSLFASYLAVFTDVDGIKDTEANEYGKFLEAQGRKHHRRGYSLFIAEIATRGLIAEKDLLVTTLAVAASLRSNATKEDQKLLVEELADCLTNILRVARKPLSAFAEFDSVLKDLQRLASTKKEDLPGLSFKARFAIMDCLGI